jgi:hypothetical protein
MEIVLFLRYWGIAAVWFRSLEGAQGDISGRLVTNTVTFRVVEKRREKG